MSSNNECNSNPVNDQAVAAGADVHLPDRNPNYAGANVNEECAMTSVAARETTASTAAAVSAATPAPPPPPAPAVTSVNTNVTSPPTTVTTINELSHRQSHAMTPTISCISANIPPPPYEVATKLPTYDEVQREKNMQGAYQPTLTTFIPNTDNATNANINSRPIGIFSIDNESDNSSILGTDVMFFVAFFFSFFFNWIGFLMIMLFWRTIATHYGAMSGFGLSLVKWSLIMINSQMVKNSEHSLLLWLIIISGMFLCFRSTLRYFTIKKNWNDFTNRRQNNFLFFY